MKDEQKATDSILNKVYEGGEGTEVNLPNWDLDWQSKGPEGTITISKGYFEHLLNCLANQTYINELRPKDKLENQAVIDKAWREGMFIMGLSSGVMAARYKELVERWCEAWNENIGFIKASILSEKANNPDDLNVEWKWVHIAEQEILMWIRLCVFFKAKIDIEGQRYEVGQVAKDDFDFIVERRGLSPVLRQFLIDLLKAIGIGKNL